MDKGQFETGCSSAATHRLTQASTTLNRRYVQRPSNIAIEEAAKSATSTSSEADNNYTPSRLVNLGIHRAELEAALAAPEPPVEQASNLTNPTAIVPAVLEFGQDPSTMNQAANSMANNAYYSSANSGTYASPTTSLPADQSAMPTPQQPEIDTATLAMNIAADYAAASLGASVAEYGNNYQNYAMPESQASIPESTNPDSVEAIAQAASNAIASIRTATQPDEVAEQVASLKTFADNIKSGNAAPEMRELGDTIDKFVKIAMKSTGVKEAVAKKSTTPTVTLSSKATRAAAKVTKSSAKIMATNRNKATAMARKPSMSRPVSSRTGLQATRRSSPEELKERAIQQALRSVATMDEENRRHPAAKAAIRPRKKKGGAKRFLIAFTCAAACVGAVIYFVSTNMPDISVRVAAMQTGMQATYPSYVPRDYSLGDIFSEDGKITMIFNGPNQTSFTLVEEKSSWDSAALLRNYVEEEWGDDYTTTHEQGITIYITNSDAAWVNGGILYKITSNSNSLTKKQLRNIVVSL